MFENTLRLFDKYCKVTEISLFANAEQKFLLSPATIALKDVGNLFQVVHWKVLGSEQVKVAGLNKVPAAQ